MKYIIPLISFFVFFSCEDGNTNSKNTKSEEVFRDLIIVDTFEVFTYGPDSTYSRKIQIQDTIAYLANSNGRIYAYDLINGSTNNTEDFELSELRDLHLTSNKILGLQSGNGFKIISINNRFELDNVRIIEPASSDTAFMDGFSFNKSNGVVMGDPEDNYFQIFTTKLAGEFWTKYPIKIPALKGEAGYAASGSTIQMISDSTFYWVSGGSQNRFFKCNFDGTYVERKLPMVTGEGAGPFSMYFSNATNGVIVGGDYINSEDRDSISVFTTNAGNTWTLSETAPTGYRSSVIGTKDGNLLICAGRNGIDYSKDGGENWIHFSKKPLFSLTIHDTYVYGTMKSGQFCRFNLNWFKTE